MTDNFTNFHKKTYLLAFITSDGTHVLMSYNMSLLLLILKLRYWKIIETQCPKKFQFYSKNNLGGVNLTFIEYCIAALLRLPEKLPY